jgi:filamentous hemagglutinin family protein
VELMQKLAKEQNCTILRAMGYRDRDLLLIVLEQSLILALLGFVPGLALALGPISLLSVAGHLGVLSNSVQAQVVPDGTLPTVVTGPDSRNFAIDGGSRSGANLFHSFRQFSVPTGGSAVFNHAADVQNIFSRVTGGNASTINGLIQTGSANLFLLNPSGIVFGPNAQLNIGGSFLGTTASSIRFGDGVEFSATQPMPLLTISMPVGLQMGQTANIEVQDLGHTQIYDRGTLLPFDRSNYSEGLAVAGSKTLTLLGGNILLNSGLLIAEDGRVNLGAVGVNNFVSLASTPLG